MTTVRPTCIATLDQLKQYKLLFSLGGSAWIVVGTAIFLVVFINFVIGLTMFLHHRRPISRPPTKHELQDLDDEEEAIGEEEGDEESGHTDKKKGKVSKNKSRNKNFKHAAKMPKDTGTAVEKPARKESETKTDLASLKF